MTHINLISKTINLYMDSNPDFKSILNILEQEEEKIVIDHISFRTFDFRSLGIDVLAIPFIEAGYQETKRYTYQNQVVNARHYTHATDKSAPLIFFSELSTYKFSKSLQEIIKTIVDRIPINILCSDKIFLTPTPWKSIHYSIYEQLKSESEYAAGIYANGFLAHHIGIRINNLRKYDNTGKICAFLREKQIPHSIKNNSSQNHIISLIEQVMLKMDNKKKTFLEGDFDIPTPFPEFTKRNYMEDNKMFMGFLPNVSFQKPGPMNVEQINQLILEDS